MVVPSLLLAAVCGASAALPGPVKEAVTRVEAAARAVTAGAREKGPQAEARAYELAQLGHEALGPGYNPAEASEILARMAAWLMSEEGRAASAGASGEDAARGLLERAARASHPAIGSGRGSRGASHWCDFVVGAAALRPSVSADAAVAALRTR